MAFFLGKNNAMDIFNLTHYFQRQNIAANINVRNKKVAFDHLAQLLSQDHPNLHNKIHDALIKRERLGSTAVGHRVAIPHASIEDIDTPIIAVLTLEKDIDFDAPHETQVDIAVGLITPPSKTDKHIDLMSTLSKLLSTKSVLNDLHQAKTTDELYNCFMMACTTE